MPPHLQDQLYMRHVSAVPVCAVCCQLHVQHCRLHRRHSAGTTKGPQLAFELRPLRITDDGELLKPDGMLSQDEDAALRRTIAALVLNLRGIDPDLRESGLDMLSSLARRRSQSTFFLYVAQPVCHSLLKIPCGTG